MISPPSHTFPNQAIFMRRARVRKNQLGNTIFKGSLRNAGRPRSFFALFIRHPFRRGRLGPLPLRSPSLMLTLFLGSSGGQNIPCGTLPGFLSALIGLPIAPTESSNGFWQESEASIWLASLPSKPWPLPRSILRLIAADARQLATRCSIHRCHDNYDCTSPSSSALPGVLLFDIAETLWSRATQGRSPSEGVSSPPSPSRARPTRASAAFSAGFSFFRLPSQGAAVGDVSPETLWRLGACYAPNRFPSVDNGMIIWGGGGGGGRGRLYRIDRGDHEDNLQQARRAPEPPEGRVRLAVGRHGG